MMDPAMECPFEPRLDLVSVSGCTAEFKIGHPSDCGLAKAQGTLSLTTTQLGDGDGTARRAAPNANHDTRSILILWRSLSLIIIPVFFLFLFGSIFRGEGSLSLSLSRFPRRDDARPCL